MPELIVANRELVVQDNSNYPVIQLNYQENNFLINEISRGNQVIINSSSNVIITTTATTNTTWGTYYISNGTSPSPTTVTTATNSIGLNNYYFLNNTSQYTNVSNIPWTPPKVKRGPLIKKTVRNSIKRAMSLISNFGFEEEVRIFLGGDKVEVSHPDSPFKFVIEKYKNSLIRETQYPGYSTPYRLELYSKTDIHIANLCVIMESTPLLDQVLALAMFVKSGNENKLLHKANYSQLCPDIGLRKILANGDNILEAKLRVNHVNISDILYS